jgi:maleylpyruvate isomerase
MPTLEEEEAFSYLRARQGAGARYDAEGAPAQELTWARRGTAYFARLLNNLTNEELDAPSSIAGWSRAHVVAAVAFNAKDLTRIVEAARLGLTDIALPTEDQREEIAFAATLPAHALRNLFKHSEVHLNVEWRDLTTEQWRLNINSVRDTIEVRHTPQMRAAFTWNHAVALRSGGSVRDFPLDMNTSK